MPPSERRESRGGAAAPFGGGHQKILDSNETFLGGEAPPQQAGTYKTVTPCNPAGAAIPDICRGMSETDIFGSLYY